MLEEAFQEKVIRWLNKHHVYYLRTQMGTKSGIPDILCCMNGWFVGLELKRPDGKGHATLQQEKAKQDILDSGGIGVIIKSIEELEVLYERTKRHNRNDV